MRVLDVGTGASCVYPVVGAHVYDWDFVGSDINPAALEAAGRILEGTPGLGKKVELRLQADRKKMFSGVVKQGEVFDLTLCNPPFHASMADADARNRRKWKNLGHRPEAGAERNFGGQNAELWCPGGERAFICDMIAESRHFATQALWFSSLVSRKNTLPFIENALKKAQVTRHKTVEMRQGQKISRFVTWTFMTEKQVRAWIKYRWA